MPITKIHPNFTLDEDRAAALLEALRTHLPEACADGKLNWDVLHEALGEHLEDEEPDAEHFGLTWPGKREARRAAALPPAGTLVPDPDAGVHVDATHHVFIEGDNLEVLKLLRKSYAGRVKLIYIDPPYNTGNDFIYPDDYSEPLAAYLRRTGQADEEGLLTSNTRASGRFHSDWLSMMYPRLRLARDLLREDGAIFVSIDDNEVHHLRMLMDEVFGEENFITTVIWQKVFSPKNTAKHFSEDHDYIVVYARDAEIWRPVLLPRSEETKARYSNPDDDPRGPWSSSDLTARNYYAAGQYKVTGPTGKTFGPGVGRYWRSNYEKFLELDADNRIWWGEDGENMPRLKRFLSEVREGVIPQTLWQYEVVGHTQEAKKELLANVSFEETENVLNTVKPVRLLKRVLHIATEVDNGDIVLDFFAGSASTAQAVLQKNHEDNGNRRFIVVQLPVKLPKPEPRLSTIADIGRERIRRVIAQMQAQDEDQLDMRPDEDLGFKAYRLARSNFKAWKTTAPAGIDDVQAAFDTFETPLVEGWQRRDLLTEILLMEGFPLDSTVTPQPAFEHNSVLLVTSGDLDHRLWICLDATLAPQTIAHLDLADKDLFICLDAALNDETKVQLSDVGAIHVI